MRCKGEGWTHGNCPKHTYQAVAVPLGCWMVIQVAHYSKPVPPPSWLRCIPGRAVNIHFKIPNEGQDSYSSASYADL